MMGEAGLIRRRVSGFANFAGGQLGVQFLNTITGLALLRFFAPSDYAIYALAFAVQSTLGILTDLGFGSAIIALSGQKFHDAMVVGEYIAAASGLRRKILFALSTLLIISWPIWSRSSGISSLILIGLALPLVISLQFQSWAAYYDAPLLMHHRMAAYYAPQLLGVGLRLLVCFLLFQLGYLTPITATWCGTLGVVLTGVLYRRLSFGLAIIPPRPPRERTTELIRYLLPLLPGTLYMAFQAQIGVFLIAILGHREQVADVAALGRLSQLFVALNVSNAVLLAPYMAKASPTEAKTKYVKALILVVLLGFSLYIFGLLVPEPFIFLLGNRYLQLRNDVSLVIGAAAIAYVSGAMWSMNSARRWVFWWSGSAQLIVVLGAQIASVLVLPVQTTRGILEMGIVAAVASLSVQIALCAEGLRRGSILRAI